MKIMCVKAKNQKTIWKRTSSYICRCLILAILFLNVIGCGKKEIYVEKEDEPAEILPTIGFSFDSFVIERWQRDRDVFVSTAKELGAEVNVQSANGEVEVQIEQIEYFIEKNVDAIVIVATDATALTSTVEKAKKAGIPVICYDRVILNSNADLFISFDNEMVGTLMATSLLDAAGDHAKVVMICGPESDYNVNMVGKGFEVVAEEKGMEILGSYHCDGWRAELAYEFINDNFEMIQQADAIMCGNDSLAGEAIHALAERRLAGEIPVVGQDAELEACQRVIEGTQLMTVYKPVEILAKTAAAYAVKLAKKEPLGETGIFFDGTYEIPYVALEPIKVNKKNMDNVIIDSGFHLKEDVYLNAK